MIPVVNNICVLQVNGGNEYQFFTPQNLFIGAILAPPDGQFMIDSKLIDVVTKALALRWGLISQNKIGKN